MMKQIICSILLTTSLIFADVTIKDVSQIQTGTVKDILAPNSVDELQSIVRDAKSPIAIAGGRFSQGGHIWYQDGIVVDITKLNAIKSFDANNKIITVETGIRWKNIQDFIAPYKLSIKVMQSFNDFTVGGSLSVNVHGRDIHYGPLVDTILSIKILLADGTIVTASREQNSDLFSAAIGGYGAIGIIVEATISLTENYTIECHTKRMKLSEYKKFFYDTIYQNQSVALHNANMNPADGTDVLSVTWYKNMKPLTHEAQAIPRKPFYWKEVLLQKILAYMPGAKKSQLTIADHFVHKKDTIVWRNYEMSTPVATLEFFTRKFTTTVLQEYFIPVDKLELFSKQLMSIVEQYGVNVLNISIRYVPRDTQTVLAYAQQDCFALVLFINLVNSEASYTYAQKWTRHLIDYALSCKGTYYLPYQLFATQQQFEQAYPNHQKLRALKKQYDPTGKFSNSFIKKYLSSYTS